MSNYRGEKIKKRCLVCKKSFYTFTSRINIGKGKYCSTKCYFRNRILWNKGTKGIMKVNCGSFKKGHIQPKGKASSTWKGGKYFDASGYVLIYKPNHPFPNQNKNYVFEHRLVIEKHLGRYLKKSEVVHHINKIKSDNRITNLMLFKNSGYHMSFHQRKQTNPKGIIFDGHLLASYQSKKQTP
jgi:hypothetical protein